MYKFDRGHLCKDFNDKINELISVAINIEEGLTDVKTLTTIGIIIDLASSLQCNGIPVGQFVNKEREE